MNPTLLFLKAYISKTKDRVRKKSRWTEWRSLSVDSVKHAFNNESHVKVNSMIASSKRKGRCHMPERKYTPSRRPYTVSGYPSYSEPNHHRNLKLRKVSVQ